MGPHVCGDRTALRETAVAHWTFERFLSTVSAEVGSKISSLSKGFLTNRTLVRFFPRVRTEVGF